MAPDPKERLIVAISDSNHAIADSTEALERAIPLLERLEKMLEAEAEAQEDARRAARSAAERARAERWTLRDTAFWLLRLPEFRLTIAAIMGALLARYGIPVPAIPQTPAPSTIAAPAP